MDGPPRLAARDTSEVHRKPLYLEKGQWHSRLSSDWPRTDAIFATLAAVCMANLGKSCCEVSSGRAAGCEKNGLGTTTARCEIGAI